MRKLHEWFGLITTIVVIIVSATGVLLIHRKSLGLDRVGFNLPGYSVPPSVDASDIVEAGEHILINTKQGVFVKGNGEWRGTLPVQVRQLTLHQGVAYACAKDGLYLSEDHGLTWTNLMPGEDVRALLFSGPDTIGASAKGVFRLRERRGEEIVSFGKKPLDVRKIQPAGDGFLLAAKEGVFSLPAGGELNAVLLPVETGAAPVSLQRIITDLHNGEFFGRLGFLAIDATGIGLVLLSLTGAYIWYLPWKKKRQVMRARGVR